MYAENIKETIDRFIINLYLYADDSQLLANMKIITVIEHRRRLETCVESLWDWCCSRLLQLTRTRPKLSGSVPEPVKLTQLDVMSLNLCSAAVEPADYAHDLGVILDSELSMRAHISKIYLLFHLRHLQKLHPLIDKESSQCLTSAFILSKVNYCNAILEGLPTSALALHHCSEF